MQSKRIGERLNRVMQFRLNLAAAFLHFTLQLFGQHIRQARMRNRVRLHFVSSRFQFAQLLPRDISRPIRHRPNCGRVDKEGGTQSARHQFITSHRALRSPPVIKGNDDGLADRSHTT